MADARDRADPARASAPVGTGATGTSPAGTSGLLDDLIGEPVGQLPAAQGGQDGAVDLSTGPQTPQAAPEPAQAPSREQAQAPAQAQGAEPLQAPVTEAGENGLSQAERPSQAEQDQAAPVPAAKKPSARRTRRPSWLTPAPHHAREPVPVQTFVLRKNARTRRDELSRFVAHLPLGQDWELRIRAWSPSHTDDQRGYLWGVVYKTLAAFTGHDVNEIHDIYLGLFFGREDKVVLGVPVSRPVKRSSGLGTKVYFEYTDFIRRHAMDELGCFIPLPEKDLEARLRARLQAEIDAETRALGKDAAEQAPEQEAAGSLQESAAATDETRTVTDAPADQAHRTSPSETGNPPHPADGPWDITLF